MQINDSWETSDNNRISWFCYTVVFLNGGLFFLSDWKRTGIPFFREGYLLILCLITLWLIIRHKQWFFSFWINSALLIYVIFIFAVPAISALMKFGQPLLYGLLEERRCLFYLVFLPVFYGLCIQAISPNGLIKCIKVTSCLCMALAFLYFLGILSQNQHVFFATQDTSARVVVWDQRNATRFPIGTPYVVTSMLFIMLNFSKSKISIFDSLFLVVAFLYLFFIDQSRLTLVFTLGVFFVLLFTNIKFLLRLSVPIAAIIVLLVCLFMGTDLLQGAVAKVTFMVNDATMSIEDRVRYTTTVTVLNSLADNYLLGLGSLSQQWNGGFSDFYSDNFFLTDVGVIGIIYRFGFLVVGLLVFYYGMFLSGMRGTHSFVVKGIVYFFLVRQLVYFAFESDMIWGGHVLGVILAMLYYEKFFLIREKDEGRSAPPLGGESSIAQPL